MATERYFRKTELTKMDPLSRADYVYRFIGDCNFHMSQDEREMMFGVLNSSICKMQVMELTNEEIKTQREERKRAAMIAEQERIARQEEERKAIREIYI